MQAQIANQDSNDETIGFMKNLLETDTDEKLNPKPEKPVPSHPPNPSLEKQIIYLITEGIFTVSADSLTGTQFQNFSGKERQIKFKALGCWARKGSGQECDARGNSEGKAGEGYLLPTAKENCLVIQSPRGISSKREPEAFSELECEIKLEPMEIITFIRNDKPHSYIYKEWTGDLIIEWSLL
ncbi:hypothetical protein [Microcoleus sp. B3-D7]|uniref:hypothetical protein n=1 Tax=Microcoleus sp. B3-D7 TaxID=2818659 RepID=UPI002FD1C8C6